LCHVCGGNTLLDPVRPGAHVHGAVLEGLLAGRDPHRAPDQVGVGELLPRPLLAVVEQDRVPRRLERRGGPLRDLLGTGQDDDVDVVRGDRGGPADPVAVVALLAVAAAACESGGQEGGAQPSAGRHFRAETPPAAGK